MWEVVAPIIAALIGAVGGIVATSWQFRKQLEERLRTELYSRRMETYPKLWEAMEPLAIYAPATPVGVGALAKVAAYMRAWYYREGGFYFSEQSRERYGAVQEATGSLIGGRDADQILDEAELAPLRAAASSLRTEMTRDCSTRGRTALERLG
jgi:hypothetical protein